MKIVQFSNGKYGVRTYWFFGWHFKSRTPGFNWTLGSECIDCCFVNTIDDAKKLANRKQKTDYKILEDA